MTASIRVALMAAALGVVGMVACGNPTGLTASFSTITDTFQLYTLNSAPQGAPNAVYTFGFQTSGSLGVRAGSGLAFDVALDLTPDGKVVLYPVRRVANALGRGHQVGLQVANGTFESLTSAPRNGYTYDSTKTVSVGQAVAYEANNSASCQFSYNGYSVYGKLVVDSVDIAQQKLYVRATVNPNCGFRSFAPGVPKN
ncbi:MAG: hypothetical protein ACYC3Q_07240 [Gemmatimonadaceae bacterium]